MKPLLRGFLVMLSKPKLWGYAWKPLAWAALVYVLLLVLGQMWLMPLIAQRVPGGGLLDYSVTIGFGLALTFVWLILANFIYLAIAGIISSFLWEKLSLEAERGIFKDAPESKIHIAVYLADTIARLVFAGVIIFVALMLGWLGIVIALAAAGILSLVDFSASAYLRRGVVFPAQLRVFKSPAALGFIVGCGVLSLLPFVFVLAIPAMVVGGTILCREAQAKPPT